LTDAQKTYALADVTHLRVIYENLSAELDKSGRKKWVAEEMAVLNDPATYQADPDNAWKRVKTRTSSGKFLSIVRELARFRELHAKNRNIPRNRVFKDDALVEIASTKPTTEDDLGRSRLLLREARRGDIATGILAAVQAGLNTKTEDAPRIDTSREKLQVNPALADMLRVLVKSAADNEGVAQKLIANSADLDAIAGGLRDVAALSGWRKEVFGADALRLCDGEIGLAVKGEKVVTFTL
jgi:ribonuclease D